MRECAPKPEDRAVKKQLLDMNKRTRLVVAAAMLLAPGSLMAIGGGGLPYADTE